MLRSSGAASFASVPALALAACLAVGCFHGAPMDEGATGGESTTAASTTTSTTGAATSGSSAGSTTKDDSSGAADTTDASTSTGESGDPTTTTSDLTGTTSGDATSEATTEPNTTEPNTTEPNTTEPPPPDFDALPWIVGDDVGYGVAYKDTQDPSARNVFIGYAGYPIPLDHAESWTTALYHARLRDLGVRHVYAVQGPNAVQYQNFEIGNSHIAGRLTTEAAGAAFVLVAAHSSGSYVAHELLAQLAGGYDPEGVTAGLVVYYNLDGGTSYLTTQAVDRLRRAYFVSVWDSGTGTVAPNIDSMKWLGGQWPGKGAYLELDGTTTGCNGGATWCLHMGVINHWPHDKGGSSWLDYLDFVDRPVVTEYIDWTAAEAGLQP